MSFVMDAFRQQFLTSKSIDAGNSTANGNQSTIANLKNSNLTQGGIFQAEKSLTSMGQNEKTSMLAFNLELDSIGEAQKRQVRDSFSCFA